MSTTITLTKVKVTLHSLSPMIQASKRRMEADEAEGASKAGRRRTPTQEAELGCHWTKVGNKKQLALPWVALYKSICQAAGNYKWKGSRSFATIVAATISCDQDMIPLGTDKYEVYEEFVRIPPKTGAMVKIGRPRISEWSCTFTLLVDAEMYGKHTVTVLRDIINEAGRMVGVGAWRPALKGPYGRFAVEAFEVLE